MSSSNSLFCSSWIFCAIGTDKKVTSIHLVGEKRLEWAQCVIRQPLSLAMLASTIARQLYSAACWKPSWQLFLAQGNSSNYSLETYLTIDKTQRYSFLSMSATLSNLYEGWLQVLLHCSRLSESLFLPCGIENCQLKQYSHAYQLSVCAKVKTMDVCACVLSRTAERYENRNVLTSKWSYNGTEH